MPVFVKINVSNKSVRFINVYETVFKEQKPNKIKNAIFSNQYHTSLVGWQSTTVFPK